MSTTMFGLIVAIVAGVFYTIVKSRATRVLAETEQVCHTIADHTHRAGLREQEEAAERSKERAGL
jgi:biopolymer transport protein ExbB/TolQ